MRVLVAGATGAIEWIPAFAAALDAGAPLHVPSWRDGFRNLTAA